MTDALYPPSPALADTSFLEPSKEFKSKTGRMITGIAMFIAMYIVVIILSFCFLILTGIAAFALVGFYTSWLTIVIAVGLFGFGVMLFFFTIKFIFATRREHEPIEKEIVRADHPALFDFIEKLSKEVGTDFPKKIILTPDVNASVSYDSSFWSMFLPVRKNLRIGLGLVNTLNVTEFKATMAHELGHFSQRSMKTGSYVYTMNRMIYNLVYQRDDFDSTLADWSGSSSFLAVFGVITSAGVGVLRGLLQISYNKLNATYGALAREMEYHADLVAVSVAGNQAMMNALHRTEFAGAAYRQTMSALRVLGSLKKKRAADMYQLISKVITTNAAIYRLETRNGLPIINSEIVGKNFEQSRLIVKNQWASHPSLEEREKSMNRVTIQSSVIEASAWSLFSNPDAIREEMTSLLYEAGEVFRDLPKATQAEIEDHMKEEFERVFLFPTFHGFFDKRLLPKIDIDKIIQSETTGSFEELFNPANGALVKKNQRDRDDLNSLIAITQKAIRADFFIYDGVKYKAKEAKDVRPRLQAEITDDGKKIVEVDEEATRYFYQRSKDIGKQEEFVKLHKDLLAKQTDMDIVNSFVSRIQAIERQMNTRAEWREDQVRGLCRSISELEAHMKNFMRDLPENVINVSFFEPDKVRKYLKSDYFWNEPTAGFNQQGFAMLYQYISSAARAVNEQVVDANKAIYGMMHSLTPAQYVRT